MQLSFKSGSIFESGCAMITNPVNTVGVMGKGLARAFKERYPLNTQYYAEYCQTHKTVETWGDCVYSSGELLIYNFASKQHYKDASKLKYIRQGLIRLVSYLNRHQIPSIAMVPVGAGLGGLDQLQVCHLILYFLRGVEHDLQVELYGFDQIPNYTRNYMLKIYDLTYREQERFAGVGSRETPTSGETAIKNVTSHLAAHGFVLSTGDAYKGADLIFWSYHEDTARVRYGPVCKRFYAKDTIYVQPNEVGYKRAEKITAKTYPSWRFVSRNEWARELHIRNVFELMGRHANDPVEFVVCWTPCGTQSEKPKKKAGGTGQAIRVAQMFGIPVFNLQRESAIIALFDYLGLTYHSFFH